MLKKTMTYIDFNGEERTEDFYFHLSKAELAEMELTTEGGMKELFTRIIAAKDVKQVVEKFKEFIQKSYGVKSPDGRRFIKSEELFKEFSETEAYSDLFLELASDAVKAAAFVNGIVPKVPQDHKKPIGD
jgi:hypothetical protein